MRNFSNAKTDISILLNWSFRNTNVNNSLIIIINAIKFSIQEKKNVVDLSENVEILCLKLMKMSSQNK